MSATEQDEAELAALAQALHQLYDPVLGEPVPARLLARRRPWRAFGIAAAWVALGICIGTLVGWELHPSTPGPARQSEAASLVRRAVLAHATYSPEVRHPVEVGADQEQHLVAWLSKRLGTPVRAPKLNAIGYNLVGGRLIPGDHGPVAYFMYQTEKGRRITLYVRTEAAENHETAFRYASEENVNVFYWIDRKLGYALSSADLGRDDLMKVANAVYQQLNP